MALTTIAAAASPDLLMLHQSKHICHNQHDASRMINGNTDCNWQ